MRRAFSLLRHSESYRADCFRRGLERHGFNFQDRYERSPRPGDLLLLWNRTRAFDDLARSYETAGATVLVAENGYLGTDPAGRKLYAIARGRHNGQGWWHVGPEPRRTFEMNDWRSVGDHILLLPQRGIGCHGQGMPSNWLARTLARLKDLTDRPVRVRRHPGAPKTDPWPDLKGAHCAVTWGSGAGIKAIAHGIPVFHDMPDWIGAPAARFGFDDLEDCATPDRGPMFHRLSWAQWTLAEVESGEAFAQLLNATGDHLSGQRA